MGTYGSETKASKQNEVEHIPPQAPQLPVSEDDYGPGMN